MDANFIGKNEKKNVYFRIVETGYICIKHINDIIFYIKFSYYILK